MSVKYLQFCFVIGINLFFNVSYAIGLVKFKINPLIINKNEFSLINELTPLQWKEFADRGVAANNQEKRLEENLVRANVVVKNGSMSHVQLLDILPTLEYQLNSEVGDEILKSSLYIYNSICAPKHISGEHCEAILRDIAIPKDSLLSQKCLNISSERRKGHYSLRRLLPRHYKDGFYEMFTEDLPQPLSISQTLSKKFSSDENVYLDDDQRNLVLVQWSQFVANDLSNPVVTSMSNGYPIECCNVQNYKLMPRFHHPACEPLIKKDIANKYGRDTCLSYVRSALGVGNKCTFAAPDQLNQATAKLDLSQLYGFTDKSQERVRSFKEGLLISTTSSKWNDALLPMADEDSHWFCAREKYKNVNSSCFISGDSRVNNNPFSILIYTIMMRNHNRIAKQLNVLHPDWTDEQLFQRAKSINIEIYRRIIFNEWLPLILGDSMANEIKRNASKLDTEILYQVSNEYAVAASRFYLSMMPDKLTETNADERPRKSLFFLQNEIYSPSIEYTSSKLDDILYSVLTQGAMKMDTLYVDSLIPNLEDNERPSHTDILAFDIQRGRDHGLQPYVKYLEICNNVKITSWKDLEKFIQAELKMGLNGYENVNTDKNGQNLSDIKPTYALEHLATFKIRNEAEIRRPKEKLKTLVELDKSGGVWPMKMYMCFSGQWLVMLDSDMKEIENFPGALITEPTAFISEDPVEVYNNILIFTVPGISLGNAEMHIFQVSDVSAVHMVEDLKALSLGKMVIIDRNKTPIKLPKSEKALHARDQYGIAIAAAEIATEKNAQDKAQLTKDIQVLNHCFEDIERFVVRLQYAVEALRELEQRKNEHNSHGEGLLIIRSRPPTDSEFSDILAKHKLAFNYVTKLQSHFQDSAEPIHNSFVSLQTIVNVCNDVYVGENVVEDVVNPLLRRETIAFLSKHLNEKEVEFWKSLGPNWTQPKENFKNHKDAYHPTFYDEWSPDWIVDEEVPYWPQSNQQVNVPKSPGLGYNATWLSRLQSRNVKIAEVIYNKVANNDKELNVTKGEHLEIIDDSRNWWKARNAAGSIGYVPHTILVAINFEQHAGYIGRDNDSLSSSMFENDTHSHINYRNTVNSHVDKSDREGLEQQTNFARTSMPRSYSMPNVPIPPPLPPPSDPNTPSGTMKRNMAVNGTMAAMRARNDCDIDEALMLQSTINDELKVTLLQREKRKDLEILTTPQIYINQHSSPKDVEEWLRAKGFSDVIVQKLRGLNGDELFALSPHVIEGYFGQKDSRRLISQIVLQKNICEYKTIRSSELSAKLARARQKVDDKGYDPNEVF